MSDSSVNTPWHGTGIKVEVQLEFRISNDAMKQLNHSPEAAAAVLGLSLDLAQERLAAIRMREAHFNAVSVPAGTGHKNFGCTTAPKPISAPLFHVHVRKCP